MLLPAVATNTHTLPARSYDLPTVHSAAERYLQEQGVADRCTVADLDFFEQDFPTGHDVIAMGMVLHDWGLEKKKLLMRKASGGCRCDAFSQLGDSWGAAGAQLGCSLGTVGVQLGMQLGCVVSPGAAGEGPVEHQSGPTGTPHVP